MDEVKRFPYFDRKAQTVAIAIELDKLDTFPRYSKFDPAGSKINPVYFRLIGVS
jgi:hypothetical protein